LQLRGEIEKKTITTADGCAIYKKNKQNEKERSLNLATFFVDKVSMFSNYRQDQSGTQ